jgi:hypothetical protein
LVSFDSDGFTVGSNSIVNSFSIRQVAWCWDAGDTTVTNNDGTIESQVRSNGSFSVVSYSGDNNVNSTVGHGLSSGAALVIVKRLENGNYPWIVKHKDLSARDNLTLNEAQEAGTNYGNGNIAEITTTDTFGFQMGSSTINNVNGNSDRFIAYCWAQTPGVSSFGGFTGNGGTPFTVTTGFKPAFILWKATNTAENWNILDSARNPTNPLNLTLAPNLSDAERLGSDRINFTDTGFEVIAPGGASPNANGTAYVYAAFAGANTAEVIDVDVLNNTMTVDGGNWLGADGSGGDGRYMPAEAWSTGLLSSDGAVIDPQKAFDGTSGFATSNTANGVLTFTPSTPIPYNGIVEVKVNMGTSASTGTANIKINDDTTGVVIDPFIWQTVATGSGTLNKLTSTSLFSGGVNRLVGIKIDGKELIDSSVPGNDGETQVTGKPLVASANDVDYLDGNTLGVSNVSGTWFPGLNAQGAEVTSYAPSPESIVFTSMNGGTTPFTGTDATLTSRTWTLEKGNSSTGPWTEVGTYLDFAANESQDGASPWDNPALEPNKFYQVKVKYDSNNADSVESTFNTFKTGDA